MMPPPITWAFWSLSNGTQDWIASRLLSPEAGRLQLRFGAAGCLVVSRLQDGWRLEAFVNYELSP